MSETCGRCGDPISEVAARVVIETGPLHATAPELNLCSHCSDSLTRWLARRRSGPSLGSSGSEGSHRRGGHRSEHRHHRSSEGELAVPLGDGEMGRRIVLAAMIVLAFLVLVLASMNFLG